MILVDTSVWIDFFRGADSDEAERLVAAIATQEDLCIGGVILTEVYQGIQSDRDYRRVKRMLAPLIYLAMPRSAFEAAASIYRKARAGGETIRNTVDCLIAACAIHHNVPLLQRDRDFQTISRHSRLRLLAV